MSARGSRCEEVPLLEYAYGELEGTAVAEVERHLADCPGCADALAAMRGVRRVMAQLPAEPAPEAGLDSLLAYAEQSARRAAAGPAPSTGGWRRWLAPMLAMGALATIAVVALPVAQRARVPLPSTVAAQTEAPSAPVVHKQQLAELHGGSADVGRPVSQAAGPPRERKDALGGFTADAARPGANVLDEGTGARGNEALRRAPAKGEARAAFIPADSDTRAPDATAETKVAPSLGSPGARGGMRGPAANSVQDVTGGQLNLDGLVGRGGMPPSAPSPAPAARAKEAPVAARVRTESGMGGGLLDTSAEAEEGLLHGVRERLAAAKQEQGTAPRMEAAPEAKKAMARARVDEPVAPAEAEAESPLLGLRRAVAEAKGPAERKAALRSLCEAERVQSPGRTPGCEQLQREFPPDGGVSR